MSEIHTESIKELKLTIEEHNKDRQSLLSAQADLEQRISALANDNFIQAQTIATLKANLASTADSLAQTTQTALDSAQTIASLKSALHTQQETHKSALDKQQASLSASHSLKIASYDEKQHSLTTLLQNTQQDLQDATKRAERAEKDAEDCRRACRERVEGERERAAREVRMARDEAERRWGSGFGFEAGQEAERAVNEGRRVDIAEIEYRMKHLSALKALEELFQGKLVEQVEMVREKVTKDFTKVVDVVSAEKSAVEAKAHSLEQRIFELECEIRKLEDHNNVINHKLDLSSKEVSILNDKLARVLEEREQLYKQELHYQETNIRMKLSNEELDQLKQTYDLLQSQYNEIESEKETLIFQIRAAQNTVTVERDRIEDERTKLFALVEDSKNTISELQEQLFIKEKAVHQIRTESKLAIQQFKSKTTSIVKSKLGELARDIADQKQSLNLQSARYWQFCSQLLPRAFKKYCDHLRSDYQMQMLEKMREFEVSAKQSQSQDKSKLFENERKLQQKEDEISDLKEGEQLLTQIMLYRWNRWYKTIPTRSAKNPLNWN